MPIGAGLAGDHEAKTVGKQNVRTRALPLVPGQPGTVLSLQIRPMQQNNRAWSELLLPRGQVRPDFAPCIAIVKQQQVDAPRG